MLQVSGGATAPAEAQGVCESLAPVGWVAAEAFPAWLKPLWCGQCAPSVLSGLMFPKPEVHIWCSRGQCRCMSGGQCHARIKWAELQMLPDLLCGQSRLWQHLLPSPFWPPLF